MILGHLFNDRSYGYGSRIRIHFRARSAEIDFLEVAHEMSPLQRVDMAQEKFFGPGEPFWAWRCPRCGETLDPLIFKNRVQQTEGGRRKEEAAGK
jgi:hypothetical protein